MNLAELCLDLANYTGSTVEYSASDVDLSTKTLTIPGLAAITKEFNGGTVWYNGGRSMQVISQASGDKVVLSSAWESDDDFSTVYLCNGLKFKMQDLARAINSTLETYPIQRVDETIQYVSGQTEYTLPDEITDARRVEGSSSGSFSISHYWRISGNKLTFTDTPAFESGSYLRITHVINHGHAAISGGEIAPSVRKEYVRYISFLNLYRNLIQRRHKDVNIASDMYNEAKMYEQQMRDQHIPARDLPKRDITYRPL